MSENYYEFSLNPLPYDYSALEPYVNTQTMQIHHDRLLRAYVEKLNTALAPYPSLQKLSLEQLLGNTCAIPACVRTSVINFGGGVYNHNFFFNSLRPGTRENEPVDYLSKAIDRHFGSFEEFKKVFKEKALSVFGSGWMWLVKDRNGGLLLEQTANQNAPISLGHRPLIVIDVWEHAYYLQYLNLRADYIDNWFCVIDWDRAEALFTAT